MFLRALLCFLLIAGSASAQAFPSLSDSTQTAAVEKKATSIDTIQALHRLYEQRRTGGFVLTALGGGYFLYASAIAPFALAFGGASLLPVAAAAVIIGASTTAINIRKLVRFSKSRETKMIRYYEQEKRLPPDIKQKLKFKHFAN